MRMGTRVQDTGNQETELSSALRWITRAMEASMKELNEMISETFAPASMPHETEPSGDVIPLRP
jgi:hypothetical protein